MTLSARGLQKEEGNHQIPLALSIRAPWSQFILWGLKDVENRPWRCLQTGVVFIHVSRTFDDDWAERLNYRALEAAKMKIKREMIGRKGKINWNFGTIVGACIFHGSDRIMNSPWCDLHPKTWYVRFSDVCTFKKPLQAPGRLKFFRPKIKIKDMHEDDFKIYRHLREKSIAMGFKELPLLPVSDSSKGNESSK